MPAAAAIGSAEFNLIAAEDTEQLRHTTWVVVVVVVMAPAVSAALLSSCWYRTPHEIARGLLATDLSSGSAGQREASTLRKGDLPIRHNHAKGEHRVNVQSSTNDEPPAL